MYFVINLIEVCDDHSGQSMLLIIIRFCTSHHLQFVRAFVTILNLSPLPLPHHLEAGNTHSLKEKSCPILQTLQLHANSWFLLAIYQPATKTREFVVGIHIHLAKVSVIQRPNSD